MNQKQIAVLITGLLLIIVIGISFTGFQIGGRTYYFIGMTPRQSDVYIICVYTTEQVLGVLSSINSENKPLVSLESTINPDSLQEICDLSDQKKFDLAQTCQLVDRLGGSVVNPPAVAPNGKVRVAYCHDLDGILMELVEELVSHG